MIEFQFKFQYQPVSRGLLEKEIISTLKRNLKLSSEGNLIEVKVSMALDKVLSKWDPSFEYKVEFSYPEDNVYLIWVYYSYKKWGEKCWIRYFTLTIRS